MEFYVTTRPNKHVAHKVPIKNTDFRKLLLQFNVRHIALHLRYLALKTDSIVAAG